MERKLRKKFVIFTTGISFITLFLIMVLINGLNYISVINDSNAIIDMLIENNLQMKGDFIPSKRLPQEVAFTTRFFVVKTDVEGNVHFVDTKNISSVSNEEAIDYLKQVENSFLERGTIDQFRYAIIEDNGTMTYLFSDLEKEQINYNAFRFYSILISLSVTGIIFLLSCIFSKNAVAPIIASYDRQKRFITDVSHEFKTPLAIMKADHDVIVLEQGASEWSNSIQTQISRLNHMISDLLSLTKLDEERETIVKTDFSISDALTEVVEEFSPAIMNGAIQLTTTIKDHITYCGDESAIRKLLTILIENAIKYAKINTEIKLLLYQKGTHVIVEIINECEGVEPGKKDHWFERFYRREASRNSDSKGHGIGLSIAKAICDQHKAKISAEGFTNEVVKIKIIF